MKFSKIKTIQILTILTLAISLIWFESGEYFCYPVILDVTYRLLSWKYLQLFDVLYLLGVFGQVFTIIKPKHALIKIIYPFCVVLLLISFIIFINSDYHNLSSDHSYLISVFIVIALVNTYFIISTHNTNRQIKGN